MTQPQVPWRDPAPDMARIQKTLEGYTSDFGSDFIFSVVLNYTEEDDRHHLAVYEVLVAHMRLHVDQRLDIAVTREPHCEIVIELGEDCWHPLTAELMWRAMFMEMIWRASRDRDW